MCKNFIFLLILIVGFTFTTCSSNPNTNVSRTTNNSSTRTSVLSVFIPSNIRWSLGEYTNEWGDRTGEYFTKYDGTIKAIFSNVVRNNEEVDITELAFSRQEGLSFHIPVSTGMSPVMASSVEIIIRSDNGEEIKFIGRSTGPTYGRNIFIPYSSELENSLLRKNIIIRLSASSTIRYQFNFPSNFKQAYETLINRENTRN
jgi:hypothetical protein